MNGHRGNIFWMPIALLLGGCEEAECLGFTTEVRPTEATLEVGESFTARAYLVSCSGGEEQLEARWAVSDSTVLAVDSISGVVTAIAPGVATVIATDPGMGAVGESAVDVEP